MLVVYTAIIGGIRDQLLPAVSFEDSYGRETQFICFSDCLTTSVKGWTIRPPLWQHADSCRTARWHKLMAHEALSNSASFSLWHDGSHHLTVNPWTMVDAMPSIADLGTFKHPQRDCLYDELKACIALKKDERGVMEKQIERYRQAKYPAHNGLFETSCLLRRHTSAMADFNRLWWQELKNGSRRDQLSVNFVSWKLGFASKTHLLAGCREKSPYFYFRPHR